MIKATCKMTYKGFYNLGPDSLNNMFCLYVPKRSLRSEDELRITVPRCYICFGQRNFVAHGGNYWNMLPLDIKSCTSPESFKLALKRYPGFDT